jgi:hypothetical protein
VGARDAAAKHNIFIQFALPCALVLLVAKLRKWILSPQRLVIGIDAAQAQVMTSL